MIYITMIKKSIINIYRIFFGKVHCTELYTKSFSDKKPLWGSKSVLLRNWTQKYTFLPKNKCVSCEDLDFNADIFMSKSFIYISWFWPNTVDYLWKTPTTMMVMNCWVEQNNLKRSLLFIFSFNTTNISSIQNLLMK